MPSQQVGKFYELYNMDATVGVKELGLIYMKVTEFSFDIRGSNLDRVWYSIIVCCCRETLHMQAFQRLHLVDTQTH